MALTVNLKCKIFGHAPQRELFGEYWEEEVTKCRRCGIDLTSKEKANAKGR